MITICSSNRPSICKSILRCRRWKPMHSFVWSVPRTRCKALQDAFYASEERPRTMSLAFLPSSPVAHAVFPQRRTRRRALTVPLQQPALIFVHHYCNDASLHWALPADHLQLLRDGRQCVQEGRRHVKTRRSNSRPDYLRRRHAKFRKRRPAAAAFRDVDPLAASMERGVHAADPEG